MLTEQLARWVCSLTTLNTGASGGALVPAGVAGFPRGLHMADPTNTDFRSRWSVWASGAPMPERRFRAVTSGGVQLGFTIDSTNVERGGISRPTQTPTVTITAEAATMPIALAALAEVRRVLHLDGRRLVYSPGGISSSVAGVSGVGTTDRMLGMIGLPSPESFGAEVLDCWRILMIDVLAEAQPLTPALDAGAEAMGEPLSRLTNPGAFTRVTCLGALQAIYSAGAVVAGLNSPAWAKARMYAERFALERERIVAQIDTNADGEPDAVRRVNLSRLVRG